MAREVGGKGVLLCLPPETEQDPLRLLLEAARQVLARPETDRFVLLQSGGGGGAFARTLALELPGVSVCVVDHPWEGPRLLERAVAEARAARAYTEAHYDLQGRRRIPILRALPASRTPPKLTLGPRDVLLVTGGGKGIAAECALELARRTGVRLALMGRSQVEQDAELAANLDRLALTGVRFTYSPVDVGDAEAVAASVLEVERKLGPVTAILHGAGRNVPRLLGELEESDFRQTLRPKVEGARNLLRAVDPDRLKLVVAFGSIIARTGMRGEADYAVANERLADLIERYQADHPSCRCLVLEWSVWSGVGMGERLGRIDALARQGITPITPEQGVAILAELIARPPDEVAVVVTGRFGSPPTLRLEPRELPLLRFLERPRVDYPGVELVVDTELSVATDPYLEDHVFQGERLLPAVMGLEAIVQAAMAVTGRSDLPVLEDIHFERPIVVPREGKNVIRTAVLVDHPGQLRGDPVPGHVVPARPLPGELPMGRPGYALAQEAEASRLRRARQGALALPGPRSGPLWGPPVPSRAVPEDRGLSQAEGHGVCRGDRARRRSGLVRPLLARRARARRSRGPRRGDPRDPGVHPARDHPAHRSRAALPGEAGPSSPMDRRGPRKVASWPGIRLRRRRLR